jgi:hypothetical protein
MTARPNPTQIPLIAAAFQDDPFRSPSKMNPAMNPFIAASKVPATRHTTPAFRYQEIRRARWSADSGMTRSVS